MITYAEAGKALRMLVYSLFVLIAYMVQVIGCFAWECFLILWRHKVHVVLACFCVAVAVSLVPLLVAFCWAIA